MSHNNNEQKEGEELDYQKNKLGFKNKKFTIYGILFILAPFIGYALFWYLPVLRIEGRIVGCTIQAKSKVSALPLKGGEFNSFPKGEVLSDSSRFRIWASNKQIVKLKQSCDDNWRLFFHDDTAFKNYKGGWPPPTAKLYVSVPLDTSILKKHKLLIDIDEVQIVK